MNALAAIVRLRRVALAAASGVLGEDGAWLSAAIEAYLANAPAGLTLDQAFGLAGSPGIESWWHLEQRDRRDRLLREFFDRFCPASTWSGRILMLQNEVRRAERQWLRDRRSSEVPAAYRGTPRELLFHAFRANESLGLQQMPSSDDQLRRIIATYCSREEKLPHQVPPVHAAPARPSCTASKEIGPHARPETQIVPQRRRREGRG